MLVLITYDVNVETKEGRKRLIQVAKQCLNYGQRVQNSVFECEIEPALFQKLKYTLYNIIDKDKDSIRYYYLGKNWRSRVEHVGLNKSFDIHGTLII